MTPPDSSSTINSLGQPIGLPMPDWSPRALPSSAPLTGRYCRLEPISLAHAEQLYAANSEDIDGRNWTYLGERPSSLTAYQDWIATMSHAKDRLMHAIIDLATGQAMGVASFMRMDPENGSIEVGNINFSPRLQRTRVATEAMFLMMQRIFDELGYRRYEWKCDSLNAPSRAAALRYGFQFEGIFRQAIVYKQRSRDTAWFSIIDKEWPMLKLAFQAWLDPDNFDSVGQQHRSLGACMAQQGR